MLGQIRASLFRYPAPIGRHPLMLPQIMRPVGNRRSDLGITPYARNAKLNNCCRKTTAPAAVLDVFGWFLVDFEYYDIHNLRYSRSD